MSPFSRYGGRDVRSTPRHLRHRHRARRVVLPCRRQRGRLLTLREKQSAFALALARLIVWIYDKGYAVTLADGNIDPIRRRVRLQSGAIATGVRDLVHMENGLHYKRLAQDLNLFVDGKFVDDAGHPAWKELGEKWESMDPLAAWGGRFQDSNHFSFRHGGAA